LSSSFSKPWANFITILGAKGEQLVLKYFSKAFNGNSIFQKCAKIWSLAQNLQAKIWSKISAEILVKHNSTFCAIYCMLEPLCIDKIGSSIQ